MRKFLGRITLTNASITMILVACIFVLAGCNGDSGTGIEFTSTIELAIESAESEVEFVAGMTIALVDAENNFTWTSGFGYADSINDIPVNADTMFMIGSISKPFTAIAVMQLVEEGLIDLDEPIVTYLPQFSMMPHPVYGGSYQNITTRMLLNHTSGLPRDYWDGRVSTFGEHNDSFLNDYIAYISELTMIAEEGTSVSYSNIGYTILGILVATVAGYDDVFEGFMNYTNENIFTPASVNRSTFVMNDELYPYVARSYLNRAWQNPEIQFLNTLSDGSMFSSANDMAIFMHIILNGINSQDEQLLTQDSFMQMIDFDSNQSYDGATFGLGFYQVQYQDIYFTGHIGSWSTYRSIMVFDLESNIGVFISSNGGGRNDIVITTAIEILQMAVYEKTGELNLEQ